MLILGIESSCDDTSVALLDCSEHGHFIISEKTASQIDIHKKYGGVVPEIAGRMHAEKIVPLIEEVLTSTNTPLPPSRGELRPDVIAVTAGPGLITGLLVGMEAARTLAYSWNVPLIAVNHLEGHIHSVEIGLQTTNRTSDFRLQTMDTDDKKIQVRSQKSEDRSLKYPALALIASGGHTELIYIPKQGEYKRVGATKDDAAGECFDKVAKLLGLPYPGGPEISKLAITGRADAINFPRPMLDRHSSKSEGGIENNFNFSFSGLKTSALYWLRDNVIASETKQSPSNKVNLDSMGLPRRSFVAPRNDITKQDFCASFEQAIVDVLVAKTIHAAVQYKPATIILAGGVSANQKLKNILKKEARINLPQSTVHSPQSAYCMDNAAMIAVAGYYHALKKDFTDWRKIKADPNWKIS